jgi:arylsulfatase A-like enzyme
VGTWEADAPTDLSKGKSRAVCPDCDVVLVTMCSVRRDHVDVYKNRNLTPNLSEIADGGYHFGTAYAASNFTLASLTAILTGRFGSSTGVVGWDKGLVGNITTLPEVLGVYGYTTAGFTINAASGFRPEYGLDKGFQHLEIVEAPSDNPDGRLTTGPTGTALSAQPMVRWIKDQPSSQRIFAMFHTRTAHFPFVVEPPKDDPTGIGRLLWGDDLTTTEGAEQRPGVAGGTSVQGVGVSSDPNQLQHSLMRAGREGLKAWRGYYAESMTRLDADFGAVIDVLKETGRWDKTILVVVADHGESLGDHGEFLHGDSYFDSVVKVPLLIRVPKMPGSPNAIEPLVSHVDLLPTILELVGAVIPAGIDGQSLVPTFSNPTTTVRTTALVEGGVSWTPRDAMRGAVISPPWTLLRQPVMCTMGHPEPPPGPGEPFKCLFNTETDPHQTRNLARSETAVVERLQARWDGYRAARKGTAVPNEVRHDPAFKELLRKSGYFNASKPGP